MELRPQQIVFCQASHLKLHSEMILLKINLLLGRIYIKSIINFHNAILGMMLVEALTHVMEHKNFLTLICDVKS